MNWKISVESDASLQSIWNFFKETTKKIGSKFLKSLDLSFQGSVRVSAKNLTLHTGMFVSAGDVKGLPHVNMTFCHLHIVNFDLHFEGDGRYLVYLTLHVASERLKGVITH